MKVLYIKFILIILLLSKASCVQSQTVLISPNSSWKYLDNGSDQGTNWRSVTFNDGSWLSGAAELGYGNGPSTTLSSGKIGYYFRKTISMNPSQYSNLTMKIRRDDGIVVYVNNVEVVRSNMPSGTILFNTRAPNCSDDGNSIFTFSIPNSNFVNGNNVIAAEVHNQSPSSSDLTFELELSGTPVANCPTPDSYYFGTTNVTANSAEVDWVGVSGASSYNVAYRIRNSGSAYSSNINTSSTYLVLNNLQAATDYEFIIQSVCPGNVLSPYSASGWFTTLNTGPTSLINSGDSWKFLDNGSDQGTNWRTSTFNDGTWPLGAAPLGYGNAHATILTSGKIGYYFRKIVTINPSQYTDYTLNIRRDDGVVVYVNNIEVLRNNMPSGTINYNTHAPNCSDDGNTVFTFTIPNTNFVNGNNVIAAEVHNQSTSSSDITFELELIGNPGTNSTCSPPSANSLATTNITTNSANLQWGSVPGAVSYNVQYRIRNIGAAYSSSINTTSASLVLNNLQASTDYEFIVQTECSGSSLSTFTQSAWFTTSGTGNSATLTRGPYMTVATASSVTIQWRTNPVTNGEVRYGLASNQLNNVAFNSTVTSDHSITLTNLQANKKYYYSIGQSGSMLQGDTNNYFYTAPVSGSSQSVRFWVTGDFGRSGAGQQSVLNSFLNYTSGGQNINGWLWLGDNAYSYGTDQEYQTNVFNVYTSLFKNIPVFPTPGNHDYAQSGYQSSSAMGTNFPYFDIFSLPTSSGTEKYYSTDYGNIHFISLDSYGSLNNSSSSMYNWLNNDLANNHQPWIIVYFHHPPYSKGSHDSDTEHELIDMRNNIIPLLESYGVDLVLSGHSHNYERSYFIKNHFGLENTFNSSLYPGGNEIQFGGGPYSKSTLHANGTVYIVCGVSGNSTGSTSNGYPHNAMFSSNSSDFGSLILDVTGGDLTCKFLTASGTIEDQFTIHKPISTFASNETTRLADLSESNLSIYPNPTSGDIYVNYNNREDELVTVSIYNTLGDLLFRKIYSKIKNEDLLIGLAEGNLKSGLYVVTIDGENVKSTNKFIVE